VDSLKKVIADHRSSIHVADSMGDDEDAMFIRLQLATLVKPKEAITLLQEAVAAATSGDPGTEIMVRTQLAEQYELIGNHRLAYAEAMAVVALSNEELSVQREMAGSMASEQRVNAAAERDSLQKVWNQELANVEAHRSAAEERSQRWMWIAIGVGVFFLFSLVVVLYRSGRSSERIRAELDALRTEITALKEQRPTNQVRVPLPPVVPVPEPVVAPAPTPHPTRAAELDPVVLAMFRKMGPERLATLRDARARGDHDKVVRVVHTLKPHLVALDPDRFGPLCASLTEPSASGDRMRWNADLDRLEQGLLELLG
jgi:hypothetical protein